MCMRSREERRLGMEDSLVETADLRPVPAHAQLQLTFAD